MSAWILRRRTVTLNTCKILQELGQRSSSTSAKPVLYAFWKWFDRCNRMKDEIVLLMLLMPRKTYGCKCLTWPCVLMLRSWGVACATAQDSLGAEAFKRVPSHVVMNVPWR